MITQKQIDALEVGDKLTFKDPAKGVTTTRKIVGFRTRKGDGRRYVVNVKYDGWDTFAVRPDEVYSSDA